MMHMKRIIYVLAIALGTSLFADGQTVIVRKRNLNSATGAGQVNTMVSPSMGGNMNQGAYYSRYNHAIKLSPTSLVAGDIPISYEHKVNDYMSLEAGLGVTTFNMTENLIRGYSLRNNGQTLSRLGYSATFNAKFFPEGNAFQDGYYIGFNVNHRNYAQDFYISDPWSGLDTTVNESFGWNDFGFTMGYQSRPSERMILDWFIGAAIRTKTRSTSEYVESFDPITGIFTGQYELVDRRNATPALLGGVRISVLFR